MEALLDESFSLGAVENQQLHPCSTHSHVRHDVTDAANTVPSAFYHLSSIGVTCYSKLRLTEAQSTQRPLLLPSFALKALLHNFLN